VELGVDPLGLGRTTRNAAMATTMMPMMMKTMSGLGKQVLLPGGLGGEAMDGWMRELGASEEQRKIAVENISFL